MCVVCDGKKNDSHIHDDQQQKKKEKEMDFFG